MWNVTPSYIDWSKYFEYGDEDQADIWLQIRRFVNFLKVVRAVTRPTTIKKTLPTFGRPNLIFF